MESLLWGRRYFSVFLLNLASQLVYVNGYLYGVAISFSFP